MRPKDYPVIEKDAGMPRIERAHIRRATANDLPILVRIHKIAYSRGHFTALLPDDVLARYYGYFLDGGCEIYLALDGADYCDDSSPSLTKVQGFAVFGEGIPGRIAQFKQECFRGILLASLYHPWIAGRKAINAALLRLRRRPVYTPAEFLLLSIAVAVPRRGVGRHLLGALLNAARYRGCKTVGLYVNAENINAINAYFAAGFIIVGFHGGQLYMEQALDFT